MANTNENTGKELLLSRMLDAPRALVFKVWTEPGHLAHWWGPKGFKLVAFSHDLRPGGAFHYCMSAPEGQTMWGKIVYHEIEAPERLAFVVSFADEAGNTVRHPLSASWPLDIMNVLTLTEQNGQTLLALRGWPVNATEEERSTFENALDNVRQGFDGTFSQLTDYLAALQS